ncbi:MAG: DUF1016 domain-containing protein [Dysgonamonadaceae bacterium]|jgi:hypothetical protein|nr:DUF1016 domain-containing protein [Dysgonamonadaceae bacterium]
MSNLLKIHSLVALELKTGTFKPEYVEKMNCYLGLLDLQMKRDDENPFFSLTFVVGF